YGRNYGQAIGDLDNDGLPDMVVSRMMPDSFHIWHNDESPTGSWLKVDLFGTSSNTEGIGARVEIDLGDKTISRYRHGGQGYLSQHSHQLHFGLGSVLKIDQMRVYWPSGIIDVFNNITNLNDVISVTEGEAALPADLLRFSATLANEDVDLSWETASEVDVDFYEIERSTHGQVFEGLHRISSRGNSSNLQTYGWRDRSMAPFPRYYRLKMVDLDGSFEYSPIERLDRFGQDEVFELGLPNPNPASDFVRIPFRLPKARMVQLELYDLNGRLLSERQIDGHVGQNIYRLLLDDLPLSGQQLLIRLNFEGEELAVPLSVR
ncbi:MAG: ASPIC/UnbV domain-containing protein, partial [Bacteroidota bacterium]